MADSKLNAPGPLSAPIAGGGRRLLRGAAVLGAAAVVSKLLGTMQKIPLQNMAGDAVYGIYSAVYPFYLLIVVLASAGLPVAVSTFVAERVARGRPDEARRVLRLANRLLLALGVLFFSLLFFGADGIAAAMGVQQAASAVRSVSFALLLVPALAALRGFFQGQHRMEPTAYSQTAEQFVRVATMVGLLMYGVQLGRSDAFIAAGATFGSVAGAAAGLLVMLAYWNRERRRPLPTCMPSEREPARVLLRAFVRYALPVCLGALALPLLTIADTFTVPRLLMFGGLSETAAMAQFGVYNYGQPLVQLVVLIAASMAAALVPSLADAKLRGGDFATEAVRSRSTAAVRLSWLVGLAASVGMAVLAAPLCVTFYASAGGAGTLAIVAFTALFGMVNVVTAGVLQGIGEVNAPARSMLAACGVKLAGNALLVPTLGISGAAWAAVAAFATAAALNVRLVRRRTRMRLPAGDWLGRPLLAAAAMAAAAWAVLGAAQLAGGTAAAGPGAHRALTAAATLLAVAAGALAYGAGLLRFGAVRERELRAALPGADRLLPLLRKLRLIKTEE